MAAIGRCPTPRKRHLLLFTIIFLTVLINWPLDRRPGWSSKLRLIRQTYLPLMWPPLHHGLWRYYLKEKHRWIPYEISPYALAESRRKVLLNSPAVPLSFDASRPPGVALLFLVLDGLDHASLWQRWVEDAHSFFRIITENRIDPRKYISVHLHHPTWVNRTLVEEGTPLSLHEGIIQNVADCYWGNLNPCVARLLDVAFHRQPHAEWFMMVSADSIPLKSFADLYQELLRDRRTRMTFNELYFQHGIPRASNWFVLSRKHAETLVRRQDEWTEGQFVFVSRWLRGAADEYDMFWPLLDRYGEKLFVDINPGLQLSDPEVKWKQMSIPVFNCWRSVVCQELGEMEPFSEPAKYISLKASHLAPLLDDPQTFFMRKVTRDAVVYSSPTQSISTLEYMTKQLKLNSTALHPTPTRPPVTMPAGYKDAGMRHAKDSTSMAYGRLRRGTYSHV